ASMPRRTLANVELPSVHWMAGAAIARSEANSDGIASSSRTPACFTVSLASHSPRNFPGRGVLVTSLTGLVDRIQSTTRLDNAVANTRRPLAGTSSSPSFQYGVNPVRCATALGRTLLV